MADELTVQGTIIFEKGTSPYDKKVERVPGVFSVDVTGDHFVHNTQEIGTSAENLDKNEIGTVGVCWFKNLDDTNFVEIGYDDTGFKNLIKIKPGEQWGPVRLGQDVPQAKADTAACDLEYIIIED